MSRIQQLNQRRAKLEADLHRARVRESIATGKPMPTNKPTTEDDQEVELDENGDPIPTDDEEVDDLECRWNAAVQQHGAVKANKLFPGLRSRLVAAVNARHRQQMQSRSGSRRRRR